MDGDVDGDGDCVPDQSVIIDGDREPDGGGNGVIFRDNVLRGDVRALDDDETGRSLNGDGGPGRDPTVMGDGPTEAGGGGSADGLPESVIEDDVVDTNWISLSKRILESGLEGIGVGGRDQDNHVLREGDCSDDLTVLDGSQHDLCRGTMGNGCRDRGRGEGSRGGADPDVPAAGGGTVDSGVSCLSDRS